MQARTKAENGVGGSGTAVNPEVMFDDRNACVTVSAELRSLGEITNVNIGAVRLFGYAKAELEGANVAVLLPEPFADHHQTHLLEHAEGVARASGRAHGHSDAEAEGALVSGLLGGSAGNTGVIGHKRIVLGRHRDGSLLPMLIYVREVASAMGSSFLGVLRETSTEDLATLVPLMHAHTHAAAAIEAAAALAAPSSAVSGTTCRMRHKQHESPF
jgi:hypothetical protein